MCQSHGQGHASIFETGIMTAAHQILIVRFAARFQYFQ